MCIDRVGVGGIWVHKALTKLFVRVCIKICVYASPKKKIYIYQHLKDLKMNHCLKMIRKERRKGLVLSIQGSLPASQGSELLQTILAHIYSPPHSGLCPQYPRKHTERDLGDKGLYSTKWSHSVTKEQEVTTPPKVWSSVHLWHKGAWPTNISAAAQSLW